MKKILALLFSLMLIPCLGFAEICTFDGKGFELQEDTHWGGSDENLTGFECSGFSFHHKANEFSPGKWAWSGFVYSAHTDKTTPGAPNQFSAITGKGYDNSSNYGISFCGFEDGDEDGDGVSFEQIPNVIVLTEPKKLNGFYITNTTYAYQSMKNDDGFTKKFGGDSGDDKDWFKLIIDGLDKDGKKTGTIDFYLADFRFDNNNEDYIIDEWEFVDLSSLGEVNSLRVITSASPGKPYTPAYFAFDNIETADDDSSDSSISCFITSISEDVSKNSIAFFILGLSAFLMISFKRKRD